ncbi:hypothetical protein SAM23877_0762 [Streptomyces ambofaciens ATCC 23877]|uniref:Uncharacterized protein n=1 Tax=Streptomyces ambofaciens (strain ATCC 23877 / 3486 / DSM 40053 / JCM 4204 / NBRC 12836 / NRRL B-2516) TaxID=278992 RepID=A3KIY6_STRA7|nr:hypothetical protein [Streptomyces ambofaciens]AKZ53811.1 hypothetical protein SAM23877_0762 [Streptomyces ambofaciens ATCC 23877]CAJ89670.1 hypothetical protein SAML0684 [Streptomyces ambofaciens ATCC 23877]
MGHDERLSARKADRGRPRPKCPVIGGYEIRGLTVALPRPGRR